MEHLTLTGHTKDKGDRERQRATNLMSLCEWIAERATTTLAKIEKLLRNTRNKDILESNDPPCPKGTQHTEEEASQDARKVALTRTLKGSSFRSRMPLIECLFRQASKRDFIPQPRGESHTVKSYKFFFSFQLFIYRQYIFALL